MPIAVVRARSRRQIGEAVLAGQHEVEHHQVVAVLADLAVHGGRVGTVSTAKPCSAR
jgi:acetyl-CoA carboxylase beta subunit